jgi:hypothetical protein
MTKRAITKLWIWGLIALVPGTVLIPASALALASHPQGVNDGYGQAMVNLIAVGGLFVAASLVVGLLAWVEALLNTRPLADTRWFRALLWGGFAAIVTTPLFGVGALVLLSVMLAYLVAGPDGLAAEPRPTAPAKPTIARWGVWGYAVACAGGVVALMVPPLTNPGRPLHGVVWPSLMLVSLGITVIAVGSIAAWAAWWGAIFNSHRLADKTWYRRLLWGGVAAAVTMPLFGFGALILAAVLIAYWRLAPDATTGQLQLAEPAPVPSAPRPGDRPAA